VNVRTACINEKEDLKISQSEIENSSRFLIVIAKLKDHEISQD
jgi:hypothetical protein